MPEVSVIVPNFNHEKFLNARLDCILNQTYKGFELIILDDASSDGSVNIIKSYLKQYPNLITFVPSERNSGSPFVQWDKGLRLAKGDYVWIAESDDLASEMFLEKMVPIMKADNNLGIVCSKSNAINSESEIISPIHPMFRDFDDQLFSGPDGQQNYFKGEEFIKNMLLYKCVIPNVSGVLLNRSKYFEYCGLNIELKRVGDYDLYFRMLEHSNIVFLNSTLNSTRYHNNKLTAKNNRQSFSELETMLSPVFNKYNLSSKKRLEIMSFYFTVYKYDIYLNDQFSFKEKIVIFKSLSSLSGLLWINFFKLWLQRSKIKLVKKSRS